MANQQTIGQLFDRSVVFCVPAYQRAYAWGDEQLQPFYTDILTQPADKTYYLGAILLEENGELAGCTRFNIVDGQQRLTTTVIFVGELLAALEAQMNHEDIFWKKAKRAYIVDEDIPKFCTISDDESFFHSYIRHDNQHNGSHFATVSQQRLWHAKQFFSSKLGSLPVEQLSAMLTTINKARIITYTVNTPGEATQIFELNNDRGKGLTQLEALKSFLMHNIYIYADYPDTELLHIQGHFSEIFRICERLERNDIKLEEDSVLMYHVAAFEGWTRKDAEGEYISPKNYIKAMIAKTASNSSNDGVVPWISDFARRLKESFEMVRDIMSLRDRISAIAGMYLLNRMAPFWPLLLKTYSHAKDVNDFNDFKKSARLMEIFSFRGYAMANLKSNASISSLYKYAREFSGDFNDLSVKLKELSTKWFDVGERFTKALDDRSFYYQRSDALYLLWCYENYLRSKQGQTYPKISWQDYALPGNTAQRLSLEHIAAQHDDKVETTPLAVIKTPNTEQFRELYLHSIGNLVLDCHSPNASKGKKIFSDKLASYSNAPLMSQSELLEYVEDKEHPQWDEGAIIKRADVIKAFAQENWNPDSI